MNISVKIGKLKLDNPVTIASGTFAHAEKYYSLEEVKKLGSLVPKTVTLKPLEGNPPQRIHETPAGMINAIGIENPGVDKFIENKLPALLKIGIPIIVSILGHSDKEFKILTEKFHSLNGVKALELNLSCPNLGQECLVAQDPKATARVVKLVKEISSVPVIAKLAPNVTDISDIALAAQDAGADAISMVNTFMAMAIDIDKRKSIIGNFTGGLSGPAIRPIAVEMVHRTYKRVKIPIVAMGGIMDAKDALEYIIAGATMVAVGTANFINPRAPLEILQGIKDYMKKHKINDVNKLIGSVKT